MMDSVTALKLKTGVVAQICQGEPLIALRADIDAFPIDENFLSVDIARHPPA
ncbi:hypothetical protein GV764_16895 [Atlantibacter hermannii]|nr:hypothetical protein [Atlantibacter hermannii]NBD00685.1 hypothetical protein [Atlantibacter hermannii]